MTAIRVARGFTGRTQVVKFAGGYHGHGDALLAESGSGVATLGPARLRRRHRRPGRRHARRPLQRRAHARRRHRLRHRRAGRRQHGPRRPRARVPRGPAGRVRPCRRAARSSTRSSPASASASGGAQALTRRAPRPVVLRQGHRRRAQHRRLRRPRADVMAVVAPLGPVYQAGTLSGNPLATAAGLAALEHLDADAYARLERTADPTRRRARAPRVPDAVVPRVGHPRRSVLRDRASRSTTTQRQAAPTPSASAASSTPCSAAAWPSPRARTRCSSLASPTPTRSSTRWWPPPRRPRQSSPISGRNERVRLDEHLGAARRRGRRRGRRAGRPRGGASDCSIATTPSGRTIPPRSPTASAGSTARQRCGPRCPRLLEFADECGADGLERRRRARHGRLVAVPRGARPHVRQPARPARSSPCSTPPIRRPSPGSATDWPLGPHAVPGGVEVGLDDRDPQPPRALLGRASRSRAASRPPPIPGPQLGRAWPPSARFRATFENPPDIGGRYSALSLFGLVPAALAGVVARRPARRRRPPLARPISAAGRARLAGAAIGGRRPHRARQAHVRPRPPHRQLRAVGRAAHRRVHRQARHRRRARSSASRSGPPDVYGDDRLFVAIGDLGDDDGDAAGRRSPAPGHPVVGVPVRRRRAPTSSATSAPRCCCGRRPPRCAARRSASTPSTSPTWPRPRPPRSGCSTPAPCPTCRCSRWPRCSAACARATTSRIQAYVDPGGGAVDELERHPRGDPRPAARGHDRRARAALPALDRPAPQGRSADGRVRAGGRRRRRDRRADPRRALRLRHAEAGPGRRRPGDAARPRPAGRAGRRSTTSLAWEADR